MPLRRGASAALLLVAATACGDNSGCEAFRPTSAPLAVGASARVSVELDAGRLRGAVDVHGGYYVLPLGAPTLAPASTTRQVLVRRTGDGLLLDADGQRIRLEGPLGCD